jgi:outer membrane protein assembly factor BamE (lipoprotein component of BamABCDE complex)
MVRRLRTITVIAVCALVLAACAPRIDYQGYAFDATKLKQVKTGEMTQSQVRQLLGTPSAVATFPQHNDTWYYISDETATEAIFKPKVIAQRVIAIRFNKQGKVASIKDYGLTDARTVEPDPNVTPTRGRRLTFFDQLLGNLGRFNKSSSSSSP